MKRRREPTSRRRTAGGGRWLVFINRKVGAWWCRSCLGLDAPGPIAHARRLLTRAAASLTTAALFHAVGCTCSSTASRADCSGRQRGNDTIPAPADMADKLLERDFAAASSLHLDELSLMHTCDSSPAVPFAGPSTLWSVYHTSYASPGHVADRQARRLGLCSRDLN